MRILVAEDDPVALCNLQDCLTRWGHQVTTTMDGESACRQLSAPDSPKLAILDWMLPGLDGCRVCEEIRKRPQGAFTHILILTSRNNKCDILQAFESGVDDYLVKPFDLLELKGRLLAAQRNLRLQADLIAARDSMRHQARHDSLTGIFNRRAIVEGLQRMMARSARDGEALGLILADLDHFKAINDTYGHLAGDAVLREASLRMVRSLRPGDMIGRFGGEEFLMVLRGSDAPAAKSLAERVRSRIAAEPVRFLEYEMSVTLSLGVVIEDRPEHFNSAELLQAVDGALYEAKQQGRNRMVCHSRNARTRS